VCAITSNLLRAQAPGNVPLKKGEGGLPKCSVVNISKIFTIDKLELVDRIGKLSADTVDLIRAGLHLLLDRV